jgi:prepilin-type processing-associated H-X9-DG protein
MHNPTVRRPALPLPHDAKPQGVFRAGASLGPCLLAANPPSRRARAFAVSDLLASLAVLALFAGILVAQLDPAAQNASRLKCVNNLKQIGLGYRIFSTDHQDLFPMSLSTNRGGTKELIPDRPVYVHFQVLSNELSLPKVLVCPADEREAALDFRSLRNTNLSYFIGLDADETRPQMLLAGDRNVTNGVAPSGGILRLTRDRVAGWTGALHGGEGNVALADGSVQRVSSSRLNDQLRNSQDRANRVQLPE